MPIWGLPSVAQAIAAPGFDAPEHCDEPWPYQFSPGDHVLVHLRGEGRNALWVPARVVRPSRVKQYPTTSLQYYILSYLSPSPSPPSSFSSSSGFTPAQGEFSPQDGTVKPDTPYIRALIAEELAWPMEERSFDEYEGGGGGAEFHMPVVPPRHLRRPVGGRFGGSH
ncbi:hypothetical protein SCHPADRAFT_881105 [Schizopora paradoxa]|uniref:Uncharacterized protein n=1 Tax=Schizopora paradoxa TaxID=27342 RepID=A0A0H2RSP8_9AGAM|nr:hypothetical protein SCHPADRAFT_881105 [Schizopora paradoxa]